MHRSDELHQIITFFDNFKITHVNEQTVILRTKTNNYLLKYMAIGPTTYLIEQGSELTITETLETLQQHLSFNSRYLLALQDFTLEGQIIRAVYEYGSITLKDEIQARKQHNQEFDNVELFTILNMVTKGLLYLCQKGVVYGVLGCQKIFVDSKIKILDPSATAEDPAAISQGRLYSPQILNYKHNIDMFKSDVYVLALCILEAALLRDLSIEPINIEALLSEFSQKYCEKLTMLMEAMLDQNPKNRPSFSTILQNLQGQIEFDFEEAESCPVDQEDHPNLMHHFNEAQTQRKDTLFSSQSSTKVASEHEKARDRFLRTPKITKSEGCVLENSTIILKSSAESIEKDFLEAFDDCKRRESRTRIIKKSFLKNQEQTQVSTERSEKDHLFTDPKLMRMIECDLKRINAKRMLQSNSSSDTNKENFHLETNW